MERYLSIDQAAKYLNVSKSSLRKWDREGKLVPFITTGKHRRYDIEVLKHFYSNPGIVKPNKLTIGYCRVSSSDQKNDLNVQINKVESFCIAKGYNFQIISDLGSGLNYNKSGLTQLINLILEDQIERIVINYKDRLVRYGYELIELICNKHNVTIEVINHTEDKTFEQELVEDVLSLITVFSAKLYGSRSKKTKTINTESKKMFENV